ncbi:hypothetical protein AJ79_03575 [Helicocarpus griseus UAMH5409]|uniref:Major facilitator superfamily (MFS) profile domain-containing protein n=1 Tax=Helicocarpus griseus UAMH5409 TaxID=1447875 RepID=A0A2B7XY82_9EURO|nr:hypothetical protein AJ79_03575 [Helicocarpus griseus UAMH5409]
MVTVYAQKERIAGMSSSEEDVSSKPGAQQKSVFVQNTRASSQDDLGLSSDPDAGRRFWFQRTKAYDPDAIATQPSVYDDPETAKQYRPRDDWENLHRLDPSARWTWGEEKKVVRKVDLKIMIWACVMFMALEIDRSNLQQALADNFLDDLHLTTDDYNMGMTIFRLSFLCAELPSQLVSKWVGPDRWIPAQMVLWSIVGASQFFLSGRKSFLACRSLLAILQGGFIPDMILYMSYFYKHHELTVRLGYWWTAMSTADVLSGFLAFGILRLRGLTGTAGWRWLFLIEGLFTMIFGFLSFGLMPASPTQTANWFRGKKGWFTEREETIMVNRVIRDDPSKGSMHNREPITPKLLLQSLGDYDLWPLYILGLTFQTPMITPAMYLTLTLRKLGFDTFKTNLLAIPQSVIHMITMITVSYTAEVFQSLAIPAVVGQIWSLPFLIFIYIVDINKINKWVVWAIMTLLLSYPNAHAIQVGWNSRNSNAVRTRTVSAAVYNMFVQASTMIAANIYREADAPRYRVGNRVLVSLCVVNMFIYAFTKAYYVLRNRQKERKWNALSEQEKIDYVANTKDEGNKRLDFRFAH